MPLTLDNSNTIKLFGNPHSVHKVADRITTILTKVLTAQPQSGKGPTKDDVQYLFAVCAGKDTNIRESITNNKDSDLSSREYAGRALAQILRDCPTHNNTIVSWIEKKRKGDVPGALADAYMRHKLTTLNNNEPDQYLRKAVSVALKAGFLEDDVRQLTDDIDKRNYITNKAEALAERVNKNSDHYKNSVKALALLSAETSNDAGAKQARSLLTKLSAFIGNNGESLELNKFIKECEKALPNHALEKCKENKDNYNIVVKDSYDDSDDDSNVLIHVNTNDSNINHSFKFNPFEDDTINLNIDTNNIDKNNPFVSNSSKEAKSKRDSVFTSTDDAFIERIKTDHKLTGLDNSDTSPVGLRQTALLLRKGFDNDDGGRSARQALVDNFPAVKGHLRTLAPVFRELAGKENPPKVLAAMIYAVIPNDEELKKIAEESFKRDLSTHAFGDLNNVLQLKKLSIFIQLNLTSIDKQAVHYSRLNGTLSGDLKDGNLKDDLTNTINKFTNTEKNYLIVEIPDFPKDPSCFLLFKQTKTETCTNIEGVFFDPNGLHEAALNTMKGWSFGISHRTTLNPDGLKLAYPSEDDKSLAGIDLARHVATLSGDQKDRTCKEILDGYANKVSASNSERKNQLQELRIQTYLQALRDDEN